MAPEDILFIGDGWTDFKTSIAVMHILLLSQMSDWQMQTAKLQKVWQQHLVAQVSQNA